MHFDPHDSDSPVGEAIYLQPGDRIDERYELVRVIGHGGMGTVFEARHLNLSRSVAIKVVHPNLAGDESFVRRFEREVQLAKALEHENAVRIFDSGTTRQGMMYLVMELLEGRDLAQEIDQGPMPIRRIIEIGRQLVNGLAEAHAMDVVHRDIKPSNIYLVRDGRGREVVKLLDFGVAKSTGGGEPVITKTNELVGTARYLAPEVFLDGEASKASDVYACGLILLEMLYGRPIVDADNLTKMIRRHLCTPLVVPQGLYHNGLAEVIRRAAAKHPGLRYSDAEVMYRALCSIPDGDLLDRSVTEQEIQGAFQEMAKGFPGNTDLVAAQADDQEPTEEIRSVDRPASGLLPHEPTELLHEFFEQTSQEVNQFADQIEQERTIPVEAGVVERALKTTKQLAVRYREPAAEKTIEMSEMLVEKAMEKVARQAQMKTMEITDEMLDGLPGEESTMTLTDDLIIEIADKARSAKTKKQGAVVVPSSEATTKKQGALEVSAGGASRSKPVLAEKLNPTPEHRPRQHRETESVDDRTRGTRITDGGDCSGADKKPGFAYLWSVILGALAGAVVLTLLLLYLR